MYVYTCSLYKYLFYGAFTGLVVLNFGIVFLIGAMNYNASQNFCKLVISKF